MTLPASAKRSEVAAWMNFSMKSRMVNHNAVKVGSVASGVKCYQVKIVSVKRQLDKLQVAKFSLLTTMKMAKSKGPILNFGTG